MSYLESPSYILIPGAGGMAWYWHRVVALLEQAQREAIAADLPGDDESAGLDDYAEIVVREIGQRTNSTLVAQSLGAFIAAVVCDRVSVGKLVFVNAMLPVPGETAGDCQSQCFKATGLSISSMTRCKQRCHQLPCGSTVVQAFSGADRVGSARAVPD